jgi:hypothetical protein
MNHDHDNIFCDLIQNMTSDTTEPTKTNGTHKHRLISYKKIPFARSDSLYEVLRNFTTGRRVFIKKKSIVLNFHVKHFPATCDLNIFCNQYICCTNMLFE